MPPTPWALLEEFVINLEAVEEMAYRGPAERERLATLSIYTSPGPAFRLRALPTDAFGYADNVRTGSTFSCLQVQTFVPTPQTRAASLAPQRPDPNPFTTGLGNMGL